MFMRWQELVARYAPRPYEACRSIPPDAVQADLSGLLRVREVVPR